MDIFPRTWVCDSDKINKSINELMLMAYKRGRADAASLISSRLVDCYVKHTADDVKSGKKSVEYGEGVIDAVEFACLLAKQILEKKD